MYNREDHRFYMKSSFRDEFNDEKSDKELKVDRPLILKPYDEDGEIYKLPRASDSVVKNNDIFSCLMERVSKRKYTQKPLTLEELSFLLYTTSGVKKVLPNNAASFRAAPSAGARHPLETYLYIFTANGLNPGFYRYLPETHSLLFIHNIDNAKETIVESLKNQSWAGNASCIFYWTTVPYRAEWTYKTPSHKGILLDTGHVCQNLYTSCEALNLGTCGIASYSQAICDKLLQVDGKDEFTIYAAPVGTL